MGDFDNEVFSLNSAERSNHIQLDKQNFGKPIDVNSAMSSVVQLDDDDDEADSISF